MNSPIMQRLKQETHLYHKQLEQLVNLEKLCSSTQSYRQLLRRFYGFYRPVEQRLGQLPWQTLDFDFASRQKRALLEHDLTLLEEDCLVLDQLPQCTTLPALEELPQALGCLYVLEGATLGGQIITRQLEHTLRLSPSWGCAFFYSYGNQVGPMWKRFGQVVSTYATTPAIENIIIDSASDTFVTLHQWLEI